MREFFLIYGHKQNEKSPCTYSTLCPTIIHPHKIIPKKNVNQYDHKRNTWIAHHRYQGAFEWSYKFTRWAFSHYGRRTSTGNLSHIYVQHYAELPIKLSIHHSNSVPCWTRSNTHSNFKTLLTAPLTKCLHADFKMLLWISQLQDSWETYQADSMPPHHNGSSNQ